MTLAVAEPLELSHPDNCVVIFTTGIGLTVKLILKVVSHPLGAGKISVYSPEVE